LARNPSVELTAWTGRFEIEGLGAILIPDATIDNLEVQVLRFPCFISGKGNEHTARGVVGEFQLQNLIHGSGTYRFTCALQVQLVRSAETGAYANVNSSKYVAVGSPTRVALPRLDCLLVDELPSAYPLEIGDVRKSSAIQQGLSVAEAWIAISENDRALLHLDVRAPITSESVFPLALRIDMKAINGAQLQMKIATWIARESGLVAVDQYQNSGSSTTSDGIGGNRAKLDILLPRQIRLEPQGPIRGSITVRSSKEDARQAGLERFLTVPEFQREFLIERHAR
jgi:hypothetical protein